MPTTSQDCTPLQHGPGEAAEVRSKKQQRQRQQAAAAAAAAAAPSAAATLGPEELAETSADLAAPGGRGVGGGCEQRALARRNPIRTVLS